MVAYPDSQAQATITNDCRNVKQFKKDKVTLTGIDKNSSMEARETNLSFVLETVEGKQRRLDIDGIYAPHASAIVLTHEDLRKAGLKVDYDLGKIVAPDGQIIRMRMQDAVWTIPVMMEEQFKSFDAEVTPQPRDPFAQLHESLFLPGVTKFFIQVESTKGTSCGKVTKAEMRKHIENHPSISIGLDTSACLHRPKARKKIKNVKSKEIYKDQQNATTVADSTPPHLSESPMRGSVPTRGSEKSYSTGNFHRLTSSSTIFFQNATKSLNKAGVNNKNHMIYGLWISQS
jgi:hypothetical protein